MGSYSIVSMKVSFEWFMIVQCDGIVVVVVSEHDGGEGVRSVYMSEGLCGVDRWKLWLWDYLL